MNLVIENRTRWSGRTIRSLMILGLEQHGIKDHCQVLVRYRRKGAKVCGRAAVGGRWMELLMPEECQDPELEARRLTAVIDHEIIHLRGFRHRDFPAHARWCHDDGAPWHPPGCKLELLAPRAG